MIKTHDINGKDTEEKIHPVLRSGCEKLTNNGITRFFVTRRDDVLQVEQAHMGTKNIILWNIDTSRKEITYEVVRGNDSMEQSWETLIACSHGLWTPRDFIHSTKHVDWLPWTLQDYKNVIKESITHGFRLP